MPIIFVIVLLFLQAQCDLTLPEYTSKIVNVGIQQAGIEDSVLEVVREEQMKKILIFSDKELDEKILSHYTLISKDNLEEKEYNTYKKKYPILKAENVYILNKINEKDRDIL